MISSILLVATAGLASAADVSRYQPFAAAPVSSLNGLALRGDFFDLTARQDCTTAEDPCGTYCMPSGGSCCDKVQGLYCKPGKYCFGEGCCDNGKKCSGEVTGGCDKGEQLCGSVCIAGSGTCCDPTNKNSTLWCEYPNTCKKDGVCFAMTSSVSLTATPSTTATDLAVKSTGASTAATSSGTAAAKETASESGDGDEDGDNDGSSGKKKKKTPIGAIVGGVIGGIAAIALIGLAVFLLLRHKKKQKDGNNGKDVYQQPPQQPDMMQQQQYPQQQMYAPTSPPPPQQGGYYSPPPQQGGPYSPTMGNTSVSSPTNTYMTTDPRGMQPSTSPAGTWGAVGAVGNTPTPPPQGGEARAGEQPVVHEMSTKPSEDHRGQLHELA